MPQLNPQMQEVLDAHQELGPEPIETLEPKEARKQPTPADAVMKVLEHAARAPSPRP